MGLPLGVVKLLVELHARHPLAGPALTLGAQDVYATYDEVAAILRQCGAPVREVPADQRPQPVGLFLQEANLLDRGYVHPSTLFRMLGVDDYAALDASAAEGAAVIHDLNQPIPPEWHGRCGFLLDGGTLEHLFDIRTALFNIAKLVRVGGTVVHVNPLANWINHGFFSISPCLLFDFYALNGFAPVDAFFVQLEPIALKTPVRVKSYNRYEHSLHNYVCNTSDPLLLVTCFAKQRQMEPLRVPTQRKYADRLPVAA